MDCKAKKIKPHESHTTTQFNWETINHYVYNFSMFLGPFNIWMSDRNKFGHSPGKQGSHRAPKMLKMARSPTMNDEVGMSSKWFVLGWIKYKVGINLKFIDLLISVVTFHEIHFF